MTIKHHYHQGHPQRDPVTGSNARRTRLEVLDSDTGKWTVYEGEPQPEPLVEPGDNRQWVRGLLMLGGLVGIVAAGIVFAKLLSRIVR